MWGQTERLEIKTVQKQEAAAHRVCSIFRDFFIMGENLHSKTHQLIGFIKLDDFLCVLQRMAD